MTLTAEDYDDMHHAIGRKGIEKAYRNHYCTEVGSPVARRFEETGYWTLMRTINDGRDAVYSLNPKGIEALRAHLNFSSGMGEP